MRVNFKIIWVFTLLGISVLQSCGDKEEVLVEQVPINFNIAEPIEGAMYGQGDTVYIEGMLTWQNEMHGYELIIRNETADSVVHTAHSHEDSELIYIRKIWMNNVQEPSGMSLTVDVYTDHEGTKEQQVIYFDCNAR